MATSQDTSVPRKKSSTYGKQVRRRIPQYTFTSTARMSMSPEPHALGTATSPQHQIKASRKLKPVRPHSRSRTSSPAPLSGLDVFDVPVDDEVVHRPPKAARKPFTTTAPPPKPTMTELKSLSEHNGDERAKRRKLSPVEETPSRRLAPITKALWEESHRNSQAPQGSSMSPAKQKATKPLARPERPEFWLKKSEFIQTSKQSLTSQHTFYRVGSSSPQLEEVEMTGTDRQDVNISPKQEQMWKDLLNPDEERELLAKTGNINAHEVRTLRASKSGAGQTIGKTSISLAGVSKPRSPRLLSRRRLIDSLVEQAQDTESDSTEDDNTLNLRASLDISTTISKPRRSQSATPELTNSPALSSGNQGSQTAGPKFTYSKQRSFLVEEDLMKQLAMEMPLDSETSRERRPRRGSIPVLKPLVTFNEEEDDEDGPGGTVRSVHELRQAGANNRFLDEIEDVLDRIGNPKKTPVSIRRSGLLDLANKMRDKSFARQFRANAVEQRLFIHLGHDNDSVTGFVMVSLLITVLADGSMAHLIPQLQRQGITKLFVKLLNCPTGIAAIGKDRKSNMSKIAQSLLTEHHENLLHMPLWEDLQPRSLSPRTLALKCIEVMVRQTREAGNIEDIFSNDLINRLFSILKSSFDAMSWDLPHGEQAIDFHLSLSALESHSIIARSTTDESVWISDYLPTIADTLESALSRPVESFGVLQLLILRLTLNVTNNSPRASDVFARPALMSAMGQVIVVKFKQISRFMTEADFSVAVDQLILVLGVMINFAEWSTPARESLSSLDGKSSDPLDRMTQVFVDNQEMLSEAESVEESQKNVAFGYLSVLLGYCSLLPDISERVQKRQPKKTLEPLIASIEEFIGHHKTVDDLIAADEDGYNPQSGLTARLEGLVNKLRAARGLQNDEKR